MSTTTTTSPTGARRPQLDRETAMRLAATEYSRSVDLLRQLSPEEWSLPTECPGWDVRAMAGHSTGMALMATGLRQILRQDRAARKRGGVHLDSLTALQVEEHADLTTAELIDRFAEIGPRAARGRRRMPGLLRRMPISDPQTVGDQTEKWTNGFLIDTILTRDPWMHRMDICRATGRTPHLTPDHDGVLVADVATEWMGRHGQPCRLVLDGPAGGTFTQGDGRQELRMDASRLLPRPLRPLCRQPRRPRAPRCGRAVLGTDESQACEDGRRAFDVVVHVPAGGELEQGSCGPGHSILVAELGVDLDVSRQDRRLHGDVDIGLPRDPVACLVDPAQRLVGSVGGEGLHREHSGRAALPARIRELAAERELLVQVRNRPARGELGLGQALPPARGEKRSTRPRRPRPGIPCTHSRATSLRSARSQPHPPRPSAQARRRGFPELRASSSARSHSGSAVSWRPQSVRLNARTDRTAASRSVSEPASDSACARCTSASGRRPASAST